MKHILFVDDEQQILESLADALRAFRREWTCHFAISGEAAIELMEQIPVDVIVSDMRMPGMDGAEVLRIVQERWPKTARLILSGQADGECLSRALPVTHQFLAKPCEVPRLIQTLTSILDLQTRTHKPAVLETVGKVNGLPTIEPHLQQLAEMIVAGASAAQIASVAAHDPAVSLRVLQIANSPYFGATRRIVSVAEGVSFVGYNLLKSVIYTCQATRLANTAPQAEVKKLADYAHRIAGLAKEIAPFGARDEAFALAMISNIGQFVFIESDAVGYTQLLDAFSPLEIHVAEQQQYGASHAEIGAFLLGLWGLPHTLVASVADQYDPNQIQASPLLSALAIAKHIDAGVNTDELCVIAGTGQFASLALTRDRIFEVVDRAA